MQQRMIRPVADNYAKKDTYQKYIGKYRKAEKEGFFFEAILIDYAIMEDRLRSFLYHIGLLKTRNSFQIDSFREKIKAIVDEYAEEDERKGLGISSISGKLKILRCVTVWAANTEGVPPQDQYLVVLKRQMESLDAERILQMIDEIKQWCKYRNEIIHCLMNKSIESVDSELVNKEKQGFELAKELGNVVKNVKTGNVIRRRMNLPI
jgi:hypothetical protein